MQANKRKYTQNDLRRLMSEQKKAKTGGKAPSMTIDSPLAKYNDLGQLICVLCQSIVRSEDVWKVHVNAKQHKSNLELAKQNKKDLSTVSALVQSTSQMTLKRAAPPMEPSMPAKMPKGILKNANTTAQSTKPQGTPSPAQQSNGLPDNFFDSPKQSKTFFEATLSKTNIKSNMVNIKRPAAATEAENDASADVQDVDQMKDDAPLPAGFFDDPVKDAKARNSEYKNPIEEEWEKFQHEIKEASSFSNAIIAEDQAEAIAERQIVEIDEQIQNWSRVLELERKKENVNAHVGARKSGSNPVQLTDDSDAKMEEDETDSDDSDIDEYLDWRSKKATK